MLTDTKLLNAVKLYQWHEVLKRTFRNIFIFFLIIIGLASAAFTKTDNSFATETITPGSSPFVRLFSQVSGSPGTINQAKANEVAAWYKHLHGEGSNPTSFSMKNTAFGQLFLNTGGISSQYRNGSYSSQSGGPSDVQFQEGRLLEQQIPGQIAVFWPGDYGVSPATATSGKITTFISNSASSITVTLDPERPSTSNGAWPYIPSQDQDGDGYSDSTADYVSWIKIGNEIIRINTVTLNGSNATLGVTRGLWGTAAASHNSGDRVFSPVYIGTDEFAGAPSVNSASVGLRYAYQFWKSPSQVWLADRILATLGNGLASAAGGKMVHFNTVWSDVSSCTQYNIGSYSLSPVNIWDDLTSSRMTADRWGLYQGWKLNGQNNDGNGLRNLVRMNGSNAPALYSFNSASGSSKAAEFRANGFSTSLSCNENLLANIYDYGSLEGWLKDGSYEDNLAQAIEIEQRNWPGLFWVRLNSYGGAVPGGRNNAHKRYTYATYLLARNPSATKSQFGGLTWNYSKPETMFFYNLGNPLSTVDATVDVKRADGMYERKYQNGYVITNPTSSTKSLQIPTDKNYYRLTGGDESSVDLTPQKTTGSVQIGAYDAVIFYTTEFDTARVINDDPPATENPPPSQPPPGGILTPVINPEVLVSTPPDIVITPGKKTTLNNAINEDPVVKATVDRVEYYINGVYVQVDSEAPYEFDISNVPAPTGSFQLTEKVIYKDGTSTEATNIVAVENQATILNTQTTKEPSKRNQIYRVILTIIIIYSILGAIVSLILLAFVRYHIKIPRYVMAIIQEKTDIAKKLGGAAIKLLPH